MKNLLTIVIPTWNNQAILRACIETLFMNTKYPFEVVVVDNGGKGEVKKSLPETAHAYVRVLEPENNLGWMAAHNLALEDCETPFYCMLNDDVIFIQGQKEFWRKLIGHLQGTVAAAGPSSNYVAGNQSIYNTSLPRVMDSSYLIGFCMVLRTDILKEVGGLDESLPGGDDLDLSIRLRQAGYDLRIDREVFLHHHGKQTGERIHGENWDSEWAQEVSNNSLMAKHGVLLWHECALAHWKYPGAWKMEAKESLEDHWYEEHLKEFKGLPGLNIGCGGRSIEGAVGVDLRERGELGAGGEKFSSAKTDIQADASSIPLEDSSQQFIVAAHILEHMVDPLAALAEWKRLLVPGGTLLLTAPNYSDDNTMLLDYTHLHAYTKDSLSRLLEASGFLLDSALDAPMASIRVICKKPLGELDVPAFVPEVLEEMAI